MSPRGTGSVRATITIADYVGIDAQGKVNVIGGGITLLGLQEGGTAPFAIFVRLTSPMPLTDSPALEILLADASGNPVSIPGPQGLPQPLRIAQNVDFLPPAAPGIHIPAGAIPSSAQFAVNFANGLPLPAGHSYTWRVQLDHDVIASESFYIPTPPPGPVIG